MCLACRLLLFTLLIPAFSEATKRHTLCNTASMNVWYTYCGKESRAPRIEVHSCDISKRGKSNFTISWIPRFDVNDLSWKLTIWVDAMKILERTYVICAGEDSEFEFCGSLKGETITVNIDREMYSPSFRKGTYNFDFQGFVDGRKHEDLCFEATMIIKRNL